MARQKFKWLILVAVPVAIVVLLFASNGETEPTYDGVPLSGWLWTYRATPEGDLSEKQPERAVRAIGQAAVPHLTRWVAYKPSSGWIRLQTSVNSVVRIANRSFFWRDHMANNQLVATYGFKILGAEAASAVPELQQVLRGGDERAEIAAEALIYIGHPPAPSLEDILTDADMSVRKAGTNAMWAMTNDVRARF